MIEELYHKYNIEEKEQFNPCKIVKILLADDDVFSNFLLRKLLEDSGEYQVFQFYNGADACTFFEERSDELSLVILDVEMPEKNGIETAQWIREFETTKQKRRLPIVGLTGHDDKGIQQLCLNGGMDKVLSKPINKEHILNILSSLI